MSDKSNIDSLLDELGLSDDTDIEKKRKRDIRIGTLEDEDLTNTINSYLNKDKKIFNTNKIFNGIKEYDDNRSVASNVVKTNFDLDLTDEQKEDALEFTKQNRIKKLHDDTELSKTSEKLRLKKNSDGVIIGVTVLSIVTDIWFALFNLFYGYLVAGLFRNYVYDRHKIHWCKSKDGYTDALFTPMIESIVRYVYDIPKFGRALSVFWIAIFMLILSGIGILFDNWVIPLLAVSMPVVIMPLATIIIMLINVFKNNDKKLNEAYSAKEHFESDLDAFMKDADNKYQDGVVTINNMKIEDLTSKEKVAYLKHIGFLTKRTDAQKIDGESSEEVSLGVAEEIVTEEAAQV